MSIAEYSKKDFRWWLPSAPKDSLFETWRHIDRTDTDRTVSMDRFMRLYGNRNYQSNTPGGYSVNLNDWDDKVTLNVIKSVCDTVTSRIAKSRPMPRFLTSGGNYSLRRRAQLLEKYVDAQFYLSKIYQVAPAVFQDACVFGTGIMKIYQQGEKICAERIHPREVYVDQAEGYYGEPQSMYQVKYINRDILHALFPDKKAIIDAAWNDGVNDDDVGPAVRSQTTVDQVKVVEGWHLPSGADATDGKHQIVVNGGVLFEEDWEYDYFPFVCINWSDRLRGFWGIGLAEELTGIQIEINRLLMKIQKAFHLLAVPWVLVEASSKIKKAHINNQIGAIIPFTGTPPIVRPNQTISPEIFAHLDRLYQRAYEIAGVSQLSATSLKPGGLDSGVALREYSDIETERFAVVSRKYEQMFLDCARRVVDLGKKISKENPDYTVVAEQDKYTIQEIKFSEVDMDRDAYVLKVFPSSSLPRTPAGRLAMVQDLLNNQMIDIEEAKRLLDFPDLEKSMQLDRAASDSIDRMIENILDKGQYEAPEPFIDQKLALKKAMASYNKAVNQNVPESHLRLLRQFMTAVNEQIRKAQIQQQQNTMAANGLQGAMVPGAPPAPGMDGQPPQAVVPTDGTAALT